MTSDGDGKVTVEIGKQHGGDGATADKADGRAWVVRFNLLPETYVESAQVDGAAVDSVVHIYPSYGRFAARFGFFPLQGAGGTPAPNAGPVAEVTLPKGKGPHTVVVSIVKGAPAEIESLVQVP